MSRLGCTGDRACRPDVQVHHHVGLCSGGCERLMALYACLHSSTTNDSYYPTSRYVFKAPSACLPAELSSNIGQLP